jgi:mRNA interferase ChpB
VRLKAIYRGDIYHVDMDPVKGHEQQGERYVLVVSSKGFNETFRIPLICPITQGGNYVRNKGFAVSLSGAGTHAQGVVLCNQPRTLDLTARRAEFCEKAPDYIVDEVLSKIQTIFN